MQAVHFRAKKNQKEKKGKTAMRKLVGVLFVMGLTATLYAGLDISFSSEKGGYWSYAESTRTFSFNPPVPIDGAIDNVEGVHSGSLKDGFVHIPDLQVSGLSEVQPGSGIWQGTVTPLDDSKISALDSDNEEVFTGDLDSGIILVFGTTASLYPVFGDDITNTLWSNGKGLGFELDFAFTLQGGNVDLATMIEVGGSNTTRGSFSGSITQIPEPATLFILALGSLLLGKAKKNIKSHAVLMVAAGLILTGSTHAGIQLDYAKVNESSDHYEYLQSPLGLDELVHESDTPEQTFSIGRVSHSSIAIANGMAHLSDRLPGEELIYDFFRFDINYARQTNHIFGYGIFSKQSAKNITLPGYHDNNIGKLLAYLPY